ncbi:Forkhead-associated protein [[Leptolyngbya] sp. PCC 7376]|uniref:FHA domain-containing protein n=1 Tax=[Leptolyngbya] sp. PCC 7376 TaxID=111781 RepID=UPI00029F2D07|nr:FHA domain-containing protein [[Leptolyngbya] sp. PCC 7376]AFY37824.1 Forkhead-associated protein [[Leptolyngbya] sp. PCC 7376]
MELFHIQTNQAFKIFTEHNLIKVGKFVEPDAKDINLINIPNADVVSRIHLYLYIDPSGNHCELEDQGSSNGTFINGQPLNPFVRQFLNDGDTINLGQENNVSFKFRQTASNAPAPEPSVATSPTNLQNTSAQLSHKPIEVKQESGDRSLFSVDDFRKNLSPSVSRFLGMAFLVAGIIYFASIMNVGISFNAYVLIFWGLGGYLLFQKNLSKEWGWLLIGIGLLVVLFQARIYAFTNLLGLIISLVLFGLSYFFFDNSEKK